ncbi:MAG: hypothetical protein JNM63_07345 [Spirochaetia bacterium]|nr:hypothetical protein [Spirochaetia bacterium]
MLETQGSNLNYLRPEVRDYYQSLIFELLDLYDVDGFECDFMRYPKYFPDDKIAEGIPVMTAFLKSLRTKLDEVGKKKGKRLPLSVRVPRSPQLAKDIGLDVEAWAKEGLVDMVNATSGFRITQEMDLEGYRKILPDTTLFGELNFVSQPGEAPGHYWVNVNRLVGRELYRATALSYLERGADGISLFNFAYTRDHSFGEPRKSYFPGVEPPFDAIKSFTDIKALRESSLLIAVTPDFGSLPKDLKGMSEYVLRIHVGNCFDKPFAGALVRFESDAFISHRPLGVEINGKPGRSVIHTGELFPAPSLEALAHPQKVAHFAIDPLWLRPGINEIKIKNEWLTSGGGGYRGSLKIMRAEIALYRTASEELRRLMTV